MNTKKLFAAILIIMVIVPAGLAWWLFPEETTDQKAIDALSLRKKAYDSAAQGKLDDAAASFGSYVSSRPGDAQATYDYAVLLAQLGRHEEAVALLEKLHQMSPAREAAYFKLGVEYVILKRDADAAKVFDELKSSGNRDIALSASEAAARLQADQSRAALYAAEEKIYKLSREFKHEEVVTAVEDLEKTVSPLPFEMEMARLYALGNLQKYAPCLERATILAAQYPKATDLMLLRADLLFQLGHKDEAVALWQEVEKEYPGTPAAAVAADRLASVEKQEQSTQTAAASTPTVFQPSDEEIIYNLASKQRYEEVVKAIDALEQKRGSLTWDMEMQRMYSLQAMGPTGRARALQVGDKMAQENPKSVELAMLRADMLVAESRWTESSAILKKVKDDNANTPAAVEAQRRLDALPAMCNLDKQLWGEFYSSGDYHSRYDDLIGSGFIREGTYIPKARFLQPYVGMHFGVDTKSGTSGGQTTVVQDNFVSFVGGIRAQLFPTEYLFLYAEGGINKDLLDRRHNGDWAWDWQAGIYGFKSWGPGVVFKDLAGNTNAPAAESKEVCPLSAPMWRGDWFVDTGADFSYYHRYSSWLGYGQAHEGLRLMQFGKNIALDGYVVENIAWDVKGNYTDNLFEAGPGARIIYEPRKGWQIVLRAEWVEGAYLGRDDLHNRGSLGSSYDDFRVGLSVGGSW